MRSLTTQKEVEKVSGAALFEFNKCTLVNILYLLMLSLHHGPWTKRGRPDVDDGGASDA